MLGEIDVIKQKCLLSYLKEATVLRGKEFKAHGNNPDDFRGYFIVFCNATQKHIGVPRSQDKNSNSTVLLGSDPG